MLNCTPIIKSNAVDVMLCVGVVGSLELSCALKGSVVQVLASNNRLNRIEYFKTLSNRQLSVSSALKLSKKLILLRRFNVVDYVN
jgi:hypothetical protein